MQLAAAGSEMQPKFIGVESGALSLADVISLIM
jgi:hypothetical protein